MSDQAPKVSVILAVYNGERTIRETIHSLLAQTCRDFEIIVADDGSTDETARVLDSIKDSRLRVLRLDRNLGRSAARNAAVQESRGKYIAMMDADDLSYPRRLEMEADFLDSHPEIALCGSWAHLIEVSGMKLEWRKLCDPVEIKRTMLRSNPFIHCTAMLRRSVFEEMGGFNETMRASEDYDLYLRVAAKYKAANIPEFLATYRANSSFSYRLREQWEQSRVRLRAVLRYGYPKSELIYAATPIFGLFLPWRFKIWLSGVIT
jgi:cellulose synthase/poly-beta-1,6-N-acetylglucosamine synthase-like glycosyltransferase